MNSNWSYSPETVKLGCDLDLWPLTLTFCQDFTLVIGNNSWKFYDDTMMETWWKRCDRRAHGQTENTIHQAAWSQLKRCLGSGAAERHVQVQSNLIVLTPILAASILRQVWWKDFFLLSEWRPWPSHYCDVLMGRDGTSNHQPHDCLLSRSFRPRSKKTSKLRVTGLCVGNSPGTGEFPAQMTSNAENVSIWWRHHGLHYNQMV